MPLMQTALSALNTSFGGQNLGAIDPGLFDPAGEGTLVEGFLRAGVELDEPTQAFIGTWPSALQAALQAAIFENLRRSGSVPITFAWAPGYDYELSMWDVRDSAQSAGGITVLLKSRYPDDAHPLAGKTSTSS